MMVMVMVVLLFMMVMLVVFLAVLDFTVRTVKLCTSTFQSWGKPVYQTKRSLPSHRIP
jgi:hypothetical protein